MTNSRELLFSVAKLNFSNNALDCSIIVDLWAELDAISCPFPYNLSTIRHFVLGCN